MHLIGHRKTRTEQLLEQGQQALEDFAQRAAPHVEAARARFVDDVLPAAQEAAAHARETAQNKALPAAAAAAAAARARAEEHLPHRQQKKESHKVRKTFLVLGLAGLGAAAYKLITGERHEQLPYVPPSADRAPASAMQSPPTPRHAGGTTADRVTAESAGSGSDTGGADPAEALSDAQDGPHVATTPDEPTLTEVPGETP